MYSMALNFLSSFCNNFNFNENVSCKNYNVGDLEKIYDRENIILEMFLGEVV